MKNVRCLPKLATGAAIALSLALTALTSTAFAADDIAIDQRAPAVATTLLGADSNNNGIRDDLEAILIARFGEDPRGLRAASNMLISFQYATIAATPEHSRRAHAMYLTAVSCLHGLSEHYPALDGYGLIELSSNIVDTSARHSALTAHFQRVQALKLKETAPPQWNQACMKKADIKGLARYAKTAMLP